ncbi:MAG: type II toxin-antitoxin system prevent-host-death family antitoxin [Gulosibacter sp.]|uniref:type II toxin-antitoxin system prevent-host-death family antitoxin n=1 Tax=Gulosibacter sp. TaxID=2817531 RepID=UPI003F900AE5
MDTSITSRDFNRDVSAAKRAAEHGPVTITDHGRPSHVLMTAEEFDRLSGQRESVGDRLWSRNTQEVELELLERRMEPPRELDL